MVVRPREYLRVIDVLMRARRRRLLMVHVKGPVRIAVPMARVDGGDRLLVYLRELLMLMRHQRLRCQRLRRCVLRLGVYVALGLVVRGAQRVEVRADVVYVGAGLRHGVHHLCVIPGARVSVTRQRSLFALGGTSVEEQPVAAIRHDSGGRVLLAHHRQACFRGNGRCEKNLARTSGARARVCD